MRYTGHKPDHPAVAAVRMPLHHLSSFRDIMVGAGTLPMATLNRQYLAPSKGGPGMLDQSDLPACEGFARGSGVTRRLAHLGASPGLLSPIMWWLGSKMFDTDPDPSGELHPTADGTMPSSTDNAMSAFGAVLAKDDPQYPANRATTYKDPSNEQSELILPPQSQLYTASPFRYGGTYYITAQGPARLLQALSALAAGRTLQDAIPASGQEFQGYSGGILGALSGPVDHASQLEDFSFEGTQDQWASFTSGLATGTVDATLATLLVFYGCNSWGSGWGEGDQVSGLPGGLYRANYQHFQQVEDLQVLDITPEAA